MTAHEQAVELARALRGADRQAAAVVAAELRNALAITKASFEAMEDGSLLLADRLDAVNDAHDGIDRVLAIADALDPLPARLRDTLPAPAEVTP